MIPFPWLKAAPWIAVAVLVALLAGMTHFYIDERDQFLIYRTSVKTLGEAAEMEKARIETLHADNLKKVKADNESKLPEIRDLAVRNYLSRVRHTEPGSGSMPIDAGGKQMDDGSGQECLADPAFVRDAGEDAAKIAAWQAWCILNQCLVEP